MVSRFPKNSDLLSWTVAAFSAASLVAVWTGPLLVGALVDPGAPAFARALLPESAHRAVQSLSVVATAAVLLPLARALGRDPAAVVLALPFSLHAGLDSWAFSLALPG